jgi:hypothetical protein
MRRALAGFGLASLVLLVCASGALGQAAVDQYVPSDNPAGNHGSAARAVAEARAAATPAPPGNGKLTKEKPAGAVIGSSGGTGSSGSDGGGYPLTAFVVIVALLFLAGLAARYLPGVIRRRRTGQLS